MKKISFLLAFLCVSTLSISQSIQNIMVSATDNILMDFETDPPSVTTTGILNGFEAIAHAEDGAGNIIFWVNSDGVYNTNSVLMTGSSNMYANSSSTEMNICPMPGQDNKYYVIYNAETCSDLYYAVVDMGMNGGLGGIESTNTLFASGDYSEGLEIVRPPCSNNYRLLAFNCNTGFVSFEIDESGFGEEVLLLSYTPGGGYDGRGELDYHFGRIGQAFAYSDHSVVADYNIETNVVTNDVEITETWGGTGGWTSGTYGIDFSQDGTKAYIGTWGGSGDEEIGIYDFTDGSWDVIDIGTGAWSSSVAVGQIELGPDGKVYCLKSNMAEIAVIENPNDDDPTVTTLELEETVSLGLSDHIQSELFNSYYLDVSDNCIDNMVLVEVATSLFGDIDPLTWYVNGELLTEEDLDTPTSFSFFADAAGTHEVQIIVNNPDCPDTLFSSFEVYDLDDDFLPETVVGCEGEEALLFAPDIEGDYLWSTDETTSWISVEESGWYWLFVQSAACAGTDSIFVDYTQIPEIDIDDNVTFCQGETVLLSASTTGESFEWSTGAETENISVSSEGTYYFYAYNGDCENSASVFAEMIDIPPIDLPLDTAFCDVDQATLNAGSGYDTYDWSIGGSGQAVNVDSDGVASIEVTLGPCAVNHTITFEFNESPSLEVPDDQAFCDEPSFIIDITTDAATVEWNTGQNYQDLYVDESGVYTVTASNGGCEAQESIEIILGQTPPMPLMDEYYLCEDTLVLYIAALESTVIEWSNGNVGNYAYITEPGDYWVNLADYHCETTHNFSVEILDPDYIDDLNIPNVFTPNSDEKNDYFTAGIVDGESMNCIIYDRWGKEVFSSNSPAFKWDGTLNNQGKELEDGIYFYIIEFVDVCYGKEIKKDGYVHLIRKL